jgi:1,2-diacylglycerol 3-beta-galactosyltransferase
VSTHAFWYEDQTDLCLVPTSEAYDRGIKYGMTADKMRITGLPVHPDFVKGLLDKPSARAKLGWDADKLAVLMVSGGQGIGPMLETAQVINAQKLDIQLAVIAGRNKSLKRQLEEQTWHQPTMIYPFVEMAPFMAAADILITKAGPATISEACVAGLPMIISGYIPGQEDGNVEHIVRHRAGIYAPSPTKIATALREWVNQPEQVRGEYALAARTLGRPRAAWDIAEMVHEMVQTAHGKIVQPARSATTNERGPVKWVYQTPDIY